jgi:hypothetical protein
MPSSRIYAQCVARVWERDVTPKASERGLPIQFRYVRAEPAIPDAFGDVFGGYRMCPSPPARHLLNAC